MEHESSAVSSDGILWFSVSGLSKFLFIIIEA